MNSIIKVYSAIVPVFDFCFHQEFHKKSEIKALKAWCIENGALLFNASCNEQVFSPKP